MTTARTAFREMMAWDLNAPGALGAALAVPPLVGADAPVPLSFNSYAVSGYKVSPTDKKPSSLVPTDESGMLPKRVIPALTSMQPGQTVSGAIGTEWT